MRMSELLRVYWSLFIMRGYKGMEGVMEVTFALWLFRSSGD